MRRLKTIVAVVVMTWPLLEYTRAQNFDYATTNGTVTITGYRGPGGAVTIPSQVNNLPVTVIGNWAFASAAGFSVTSLTIPEGVVTIGSMAFYYCTGLRSVTMPSSLRSIGESAFTHCTSLSSITIPNGVATLGNAAFGSCAGLSRVTIPQSLTNLGTGCFAGCINMDSINVDPLNVAYTSIGGVLFTNDLRVVLKFPEGKSGAYAIPEGVTHIGNGAFGGCTKLTTVTIPDSTTSIGYNAFSGCLSLHGVEMPHSVTRVGEWAFANCSSLQFARLSTNLASVPWAMFGQCSSLTNVIIPETVTNIDNLAFYSCSNLASVTVPSRVSRIGDRAFLLCTGLTNIALVSGLVGIGEAAFEFCANLASVTVPETVTAIADGAFRYCPGLISIEVDPLNATYSSVEGVLLDKSQRTLIQYPIGKPGSYTVPHTVSVLGSAAFRESVGLTNINFPEGLEVVGPYAFYGCSGLTSITLPASVVDLGFLAFAECRGLEHIALGTNLSSIGNSAFEGCTALTSVSIPQSLTNIALNAFSDCSKLVEIQVSELNAAYSSNDGVLFNKQQTILIQYPVAKPGSYTVPEGALTISASAFRACHGLTNVLLPSGLTNIQEYAFASCSGLTAVIVPGSVKFIGNFAFAGCTNLRGLYFEGDAPRIGAMFFNGHSQATVYYMPGAAGWPLTFGGVPTALWKAPEGWHVTGAPTKAWSAVACSADGSRILAASRVQSEIGSLWLSTNSGATWISNSLPGYDWVSVAVSADGNKLFACAGPAICISTNAGVHWRSVPSPAPNVQWSDIACSGDGVRLVAGGMSLVVTNGGSNWWSNGLVYTSQDAGNTWKLSYKTELLSDQYEVAYINGVASSADGSRLMAVEEGESDSGSLFISGDNGLSWATNTPGGGSPLRWFSSVRCSADGATVVLCRLYDLPGIFISRDSGSSWARANTNSIWSITCSADGSKLAGLDADGLLHVSVDGGTTWTRESVPHRSDAAYLASSADGFRLIAAVSGGGIYVRQRVPAPKLLTRYSEGNLSLSWVWPFQDFALQWNTTLDTTDWVYVVTEPVLNPSNLQYEVRVPMATAGSGFYRLVSR